MEAGLRLASQEASLLGHRLRQVLGGSADSSCPYMSIDAARAATAFVLADGDVHGGFDTDTAMHHTIRFTRPSSSAFSSDNMTCTSTDEPNKQFGGILTRTKESSDNKGMIETAEKTEDSSARAVSAGGISLSAAALRSACNKKKGSNTNGGLGHDVVGATHDHTTSKEAVEDQHHSVDHQSIADQKEIFVDRDRLISVLEAEERLSAMANHLGSVEPVRASWLLLPPSASSPMKMSRLESINPETSISSIVATALNRHGTTRRPSKYIKTHESRLKRLATAQEQRGLGLGVEKRRVKSAEVVPLPNCRQNSFDLEAAVYPAGTELQDYGTRKRSRGGVRGGKVGHNKSKRGVGDCRKGVDPGEGGEFSTPMLSRSNSFTMGLYQQDAGVMQEGEEGEATAAGRAMESPCLLLPKLKLSRLNGYV